MAKKKKDNGVTLIIIGALLLVSLFAFALISGGELPGIGSLEQKKVTCDITVKNPLLRGVQIENVDCSASDASIFTVSGIQAKPLAFIGARDDVNIILRAGGKTKSTSLSIFETQTKIVSLTVTVDKDINSGITQVSQGGVISDQQNVNF